jgi:OmpA-OmpF porin, OOP family
MPRSTQSLTTVRPRSALLAPATLLALGLATLSPSSAQAQQRGYTADRLILAPNPDDGFASFRPTINERTRFFGNLTLDYIRRPLKTPIVTSNANTQNQVSGGVISNQANAYMTAGAEVLGRLSLSLTMPITIVNTTAASGSQARLSGALDNPVDIKAAGPGDLRFDARVMLYRTNSGSFATGISGTQFFASGNDISFTGDGEGHQLVQALFEEKAGPFVITQFLGAHFRGAHDVGLLHVKDEMVFGAGLFIPLRDGRVRVGAEIYGSTGINKTAKGEGSGVTTGDTFFKSRYTPLEWLGEVRVALDEQKQAWFSGGAGSLILPGYSAPDFRVIAQIGYSFEIKDTHPPSPGRKYIKDDERIAEKAPDADGEGIPDAIDACPTVPEDHEPPDPNDGCPMPKDRDKDGIPDDKDKCPDDPEDKDGFQDADGCPDPDNDNDGIPDITDACPREPGQPSPDPKQNGCPQFIRRIEGSNEIQILKRIEFATGKADIKKESFPILDEVVKLLKANTNIKKISIEGHTDSRGAYAMNKKLSQDRAESCLKYLVDHGIDAGRLTAEGFGPDKPIEDNKTADGRQKNRRTEFHILEQD